MQRSRQRRVGTGLFLAYAVASLVPVALLGAVLVNRYEADGIDHAKDQARAQAAVIEQMAIAPALDGADLSSGLTAPQQDRLHAVTDLAIFHGSVSRLRLLGFDGSASFSDDGDTGDPVPVSDAGFQTALAGGVDVRIIAARADRETVVRVLRTVVAESNGRAVGVLEVSLPWEPFAEQTRADTAAAIRRLTLGLVGLYAVLALISWWTTRALRRHASDHEHQSLHDQLTRLPNRELFRRSAEDALARSRDGEEGALVLVDLDHFKEVNDTLGHQAGDELLRIVARRLSDAVRTDDTVARLGGDEFGMILPGWGSRDDAVQLLSRVRTSLAREITLEGATLSVEASFGLCFFPTDADSVAELLQNADAAMYKGKHGPTGIVTYDPTVSRPAMEALVLQRELRQALERDELVLHYQPKLELRSGRVSGVEALVRWRHPERGLLPPGEFLPVAERCELIGPLTSWVLGRALRDQAEWTAAGHDWTVAVNVSTRNLSSTDFVEEVRRLLAASATPPERLHLEVTETVLAYDAVVARQVTDALADLGVALSIDDFGTGFTSLSQLRTLRMREIKIDRMFVAGLSETEQDRVIVRSLVELGHDLGYVVTAEGVESSDVADWLAGAGCDYGQGYFWQRPTTWPEVAISAAAFERHGAPDAAGTRRDAGVTA